MSHFQRRCSTKATSGCGMVLLFYSEPISMFVFNIMQIPCGSILICSGCITPTCTPVAAGLAVGTDDSLSGSSCRWFKLPTYLRLWRSRIKMRSLFSKMPMFTVYRFWLRNTGYILENKTLRTFITVPLYVCMDLHAHSRRWHGAMYPFLTLVKQCALFKEIHKFQTSKIKPSGMKGNWINGEWNWFVIWRESEFKVFSN